MEPPARRSPEQQPQFGMDQQPRQRQMGRRSGRFRKQPPDAYRYIMGDDCTPGRGFRDMMQPEANKPEAVDRRSRPRACWPKDASYP